MPELNPLMSSLRRDLKKLGLSAWLAITILAILLVLAIVGVLFEAAPDADTRISGAGTIAMIFAGFFMLLVGMGLMALIFYSSRRGFDEPAERERDKTDSNA